uniref:Uncharacterized protein n=2 Tax=Oryza meridionalis TaxID=40149 RepID=A0A0E0CIJ3_9ORYZ
MSAAISVSISFEMGGGPPLPAPEMEEEEAPPPPLPPPRRSFPVVEAAPSGLRQVQDALDVNPLVVLPRLAKRATVAALETPTPTPTSTTPLPWLLLPSVPAVVSASGLVHVDGDFPLSLTTTQGLRVCHPYISAADPSGLLLLCTDHHTLAPRYLLLDPIGHTTEELPPEDPLRPIRHPCGVGLICNGADGRFTVAHLHPRVRSAQATLLCYRGGSKRWVTKELNCSYPIARWTSHSVLTFAGKLWFIDLTYGLLACDPFAQDRQLTFVPLPPGCVPLSESFHHTDRDIINRRCVKVSGGKIRYAMIDKSCGGASTVTLWTLELDSDSSSPWILEYSIALGDISSDSNQSMMTAYSLLREKVPDLGLIHPSTPYIIYLIQCSHLLAVDLCSKKLLECQLISMDPSSRSIHAWEVSLPLRQQLEGCGGLLKALGGLTLFAKASNENNQDELSFAPHFLIEIIGRADLTSVIRAASTCRMVRRHILDSLFQRCLTGSFAESLFLGHFQTPWWPRDKSTLFFVKTPLYDSSAAVLSAQVKSSRKDEGRGLFNFAPIASRSGFVVLRHRGHGLMLDNGDGDDFDPVLCIWNPLTKFISFLPEANGITHRSSCVLEVHRELPGTSNSFKIILLKLALHRKTVMLQVVRFSEDTSKFNSREKYPRGVGSWSPVVKRSVRGPSARVAKPRALPVVVRHTGYWLCKSSSKYLILKVELDKEEEPCYIDVPEDCCEASQFCKNSLLLVPASADGKIGLLDVPFSEKALLGLVSMDNEHFTIWTRATTATSGWVQRAMINKNTILRSLNLPQSAGSVAAELEACAPQSGLILMNYPGIGRAVVSLDRKEAVFVKKTYLERQLLPEDVTMRSICPFELDVIDIFGKMRAF